MEPSGLPELVPPQLTDGAVVLAVLWCISELRGIRRKVDDLLRWRERHEDQELPRRRS